MAASFNIGAVFSFDNSYNERPASAGRFFLLEKLVKTFVSLIKKNL